VLFLLIAEFKANLSISISISFLLFKAIKGYLLYLRLKLVGSINKILLAPT